MWMETIGLHVCYSAYQAYNVTCGASLDYSDETLFTDDEEDGSK